MVVVVFWGGEGWGGVAFVCYSLLGFFVVFICLLF